MTDETGSELEEYLQEQREGEFAGEGEFTVSLPAALRKLANFQLPFEGAWAVKLVQALVASGTREAIKISLGREETIVRWSGAAPWSVAAFEAAFLGAGAGEEAGLEELVIGLRAVALQEGRSFRLRLDDEEISWNGSSFERTASPAGTLRLAIRHRTAERSLHWVTRKLGLSRAHRDVVTALETRCFLCPVPLWLDGRRLDGVPYCPGHGLQKNRWPLMLRGLKVTGPRFRLPAPDSFNLALTARRGGGAGMGLAGITDGLGSVAMSAEASALMLLTAHIDPGATSHDRSKLPEYLVPAASRVFWVRHGAVVEIERHPRTERGVSVALFLNAQGIESDLSSFRLRPGGEKARRLSSGRTLVRAALRDFELPADQVRERNRETYRRFGGVGATVCTVGGGVLGAAALGTGVLPFIGVGALTFWVAGFAEPHYEPLLLEQLKREIGGLAREYGKGGS